MDSMMIESNIRFLSRMELIYTCISKLAIYFDKNYPNKIPDDLKHYTDSNDYNRRQLPQVSEKVYFCGTVSKVVKVNAGSFVEELAAKGYCNPTQFEAVILRRGPAKAARL